MPAHTSFEFTLILKEEVELSSELEDRLYQSGCDDALLFQEGSVVGLDFTREAKSFDRALLSAVRDVQKAGYTVDRVEPGDLVNAASIAKRSGLSREYIRLLWNGQRGPGSFPSPVSGSSGKDFLWSWSEVSAWLEENSIIHQKAAVLAAKAVSEINLKIKAGKL